MLVCFKYFTGWICTSTSDDAVKQGDDSSSVLLEITKGHSSLILQLNTGQNLSNTHSSRQKVTTLR